MPWASLGSPRRPTDPSNLRPHRSLVRVLLATLVSSLAAPCFATAATPRIAVLERMPDGRDSVRMLGEGTEARFVTDGRRRLATQIVAEGTPERYIVTFDEPAPAASFADRVSARRALAVRFGSELARQQPQRFGGTTAAAPRLIRSYDRLLAGAVVEAPANWTARLRAIPGVSTATPDTRVRTDLVNSVLQVRGDRVQRELGGSGRGVRVGIVDTGVDYTHPAFGGAFGIGQRVQGGWDFVNHDPDPLDDHGHGTHVAGIVGGNGGDVVGMAPEVTLFVYKVLDANGGGWLSDVIAALERCADPDQDPLTADELDVVNLSLGGYSQGGDDPATRAVDELDRLGTTVVVAAGNSGAAFTVGTPGTARAALTVGSVDATDALSRFSSRGPTLDLLIKPDVLAPGEAVVSAWPGGGTASLSGTSMATPLVTGLVALLRQLHPEWTHAELRSAVVARALDVHRMSSEQGSGRVDALDAATSTLFVAPTSLAFGRVRFGQPTWTRSETLHVHTRAASPVDVDVTLHANDLPAGFDMSVSNAPRRLEPGTEAEVVVTLRRVSSSAPLPPPLYAIEGFLELRTTTEVLRVPFAIHEALRVDMLSEGYSPIGVLIGGGRTWPSMAPFSSHWLLLPGSYDAMCFSSGGSNEPFRGVTGIAVAGDTVLNLDASSSTGSITWDLRDEHGEPRPSTALSFELLHASGGGLGVIGSRVGAEVRFPVMTSEYRLEWASTDREGAVRYDIPGTVPGPLVTQAIRNDPARLRRLVEHVHVATPDSVLTLEFPLIAEGDGYFGFAFFDPFTPPRGESFDVVRWTAPTPARHHLRFGHSTWTANPARARVFAPYPFSGLGPIWEQDRSDTLAILPRFQLGPPLALYTGRELPFGSGPASLRAFIRFYDGVLQAFSNDSYTARLFRDAVGSIVAGPRAEYELWRDGQRLEAGTMPDEDRVFEYGYWQSPVTGEGPVDLVLRSRGWTVAGSASVTTARATFDASTGRRVCVGPEWFAVVAGGGPAERILFGQHRDPHVELTLPLDFANSPVTIEYRVGGSGTWAPLAVERDDRNVRARLVPVAGDVSLRIRIDATVAGYTPLELEISPAFRGEASPAEHAALLEARADGSGVHLKWRVNAPGTSLIVERRQPGADWLEHGEVVVADDGIARYDDAAVTAGARYGYRLAGSPAEVFLSIPAASPVLALAIAPNPTARDVLVALTLDRVSDVTLSLHDLQGRVVSSRRIPSAVAGQNLWNLTAGKQLRAGLYFVRVEREGQRLTRRVTLIP